ncbi:hypothetical protein AX16_003554 [Volvariella volvacea WC 439]|nr:hypothetical protein AX16_003554 [Volvariella volvacea WC 439]
MANFSTVRLVVMGTAVVFSVIVLGLSAHVLATTNKYLGGYFTFSAMSLATALLTLLTVPVMIYIDMIRKGAFTSMIIVELGWLGVLWVLWLASGGLAAEATGLAWPTGCGYSDQTVDTLCREFPAITAFDFLTWILLFGYTVTLLVLSILAAGRGNSVWYQGVSEADFSAGANAGAIPPVKQEFTGASVATQPQVAAYPPGNVVTPQPSVGFPQPTISSPPGSPYVPSPGLPAGAGYPTQPGAWPGQSVSPPPPGSGYPQV